MGSRSGRLWGPFFTSSVLADHGGNSGKSRFQSCLYGILLECCNCWVYCTSSQQRCVCTVVYSTQLPCLMCTLLEPFNLLQYIIVVLLHWTQLPSHIWLKSLETKKKTVFWPFNFYILWMQMHCNSHFMIWCNCLQRNMWCKRQKIS